jgi:hypothetical protein
MSPNPANHTRLEGRACKRVEEAYNKGCGHVFANKATKETEMQNLPFTPPRTSQQFIDLMIDIWRMDSASTPNGGMQITGSPLYDEWNDAKKVAERCGWYRTGGSNIDGIWCSVYRHWETDEGVKILNEGNGIASCQRRRQHKAA